MYTHIYFISQFNEHFGILISVYARKLISVPNVLCEASYMQ